MTDKPPRSRELGLYFALAGVGVEMVVPIVLGAFVDSYLGWNGWAVLVGVVLGFVIALVHMILLLRRLDEQPPRPPRDEP